MLHKVNVHTKIHKVFTDVLGMIGQLPFRDIFTARIRDSGKAIVLYVILSVGAQFATLRNYRIAQIFRRSKFSRLSDFFFKTKFS